MDGKDIPEIKKQKIGRQRMSMRHSLFRPEPQGQAFPHALRSIALTRTSLTRTCWNDVIRGNPQTGYLVREAFVAKEKGEELSSSTTTVRKEEKGNKRAKKAKAAEKD